MTHQDEDNIYGNRHDDTDNIYRNQSNDKDSSDNNSNDDSISKENFNENFNKKSYNERSSDENDKSYESSDENLNESEGDRDYDIIETIIEYEIQNNIMDVRSAQKLKEATDSILLTFPNSAYEAFVQLVTKHKLSDSTANDIIQLFNKFHMDPTAALPPNAKSARALLDSIQIPHVLYNRTIVMEYDQIQYTLYYRTILDAIKELLSNVDIFKHCVFEYTPEYTNNNERCYSELYNSKWWGRAQESINENANVISIIIYSDATTCDMLGKKSEHPVFLTLGNIPSWRRNKPDAKALLAYLPKIDNQEKHSKDFALIKHHLFHRSMKILIDPIKKECIKGFDLRTDNGLMWCFPFLSLLLGDLPEHHAITLTYNSVNCQMPCHICTTPKEEFNNMLIDHSTIQLRTPETMKHVLESGMAEKYSLHKIENPFWKLS
jgi:hypothetical protein